LSSSKTILLVDDDLDVLEATEYMLLNHGYDIITANSGQAAIEKYKEKKPDIVFLDIRMPVMSGYDVFFKIKVIDPKAKIILTTAFAIDDNRYQDVKDKNLLELLKKPFKLEDFVRIIGKYT